MAYESKYRVTLFSREVEGRCAYLLQLVVQSQDRKTQGRMQCLRNCAVLYVAGVVVMVDCQGAVGNKKAQETILQYDATPRLWRLGRPGNRIRRHAVCPSLCKGWSEVPAAREAASRGCISRLHPACPFEPRRRFHILSCSGEKRGEGRRRRRGDGVWSGSNRGYDAGRRLAHGDAHRKSLFISLLVCSPRLFLFKLFRGATGFRAWRRRRRVIRHRSDAAERKDTATARRAASEAGGNAGWGHGDSVQRPCRRTTVL